MHTLYFTADWCAPCKMIKPQVINSGKSIQIIDVEANPETAKTYGVSSVPTLLVVNGTSVIERYNGAQQILEFIKR